MEVGVQGWRWRWKSQRMFFGVRFFQESDFTLQLVLKPTQKKNQRDYLELGHAHWRSDLSPGAATATSAATAAAATAVAAATPTEHAIAEVLACGADDDGA